MQIIIAHRGESADAPENTMAAFRLAWERGAEAFELDVHLTADGRLAVCHDASTLRTTGVDLRIAESRMEDLARLDAGSWRGAQWAGEPIPCLEQVFAEMPDRCLCFVEVKSGPEAVPALARLLSSMAHVERRVHVISFRAEALDACRSLLPSVPTMLLSGFRREGDVWTPTLADLLQQAEAVDAVALSVACDGPVDRAWVAEANAQGMPVLIWTIDDLDAARRAVEAGVECITSNRAAWLRERLVAAQAEQGGSDHG
jgi:glycerophosphoryl diester phosphodiesterase